MPPIHLTLAERAWLAGALRYLMAKLYNGRCEAEVERELRGRLRVQAVAQARETPEEQRVRITEDVKRAAAYWNSPAAGRHVAALNAMRGRGR